MSWVKREREKGESVMYDMCGLPSLWGRIPVEAVEME